MKKAYKCPHCKTELTPQKGWFNFKRVMLITCKKNHQLYKRKIE